jgi:hypothetical protein
LFAAIGVVQLDRKSLLSLQNNQHLHETIGAGVLAENSSSINDLRGVSAFLTAK